MNYEDSTLDEIPSTVFHCAEYFNSSGNRISIGCPVDCEETIIVEYEGNSAKEISRINIPNSAIKSLMFWDALNRVKIMQSDIDKEKD